MEWIKYELYGDSLDEKYVEKGSDYVELKYPCTSTTVCSPYLISLIPGKYKFECYGASGGNGKVSEGGKGGYSVGSILIQNKTSFLVYIGGQGSINSGTEQAVASGGFNGGGKGIVGSTKYQAGGGGGSTDIRNTSGLINSRIIVAGGGGGAGSYEGSLYEGAGGNGGGEKGADGTHGGGSGTRNGKGGTQTSTGAKADRAENAIGSSGGNGYAVSSSAGGGGGGYFAGSGGDCAGGGGGSGYVGGVTSDYFPKETAVGVNTGSGYAIITLLTPLPTATRSRNPFIPIKSGCYRYPFSFNPLYVFILILLS